jgi:alpha-galactosidase
MYHHAPVNMHHDFDAGSWFVAEFASPERTKGWATLVRLAEADGDVYVFRPRGLDPARTYRVTVDSVGTSARVEGVRLMQGGLPVRLETALSSELLLFQAE